MIGQLGWTLEDVYEYWEDVTSGSKAHYRKKIFELCKKIIEDYRKDGEYLIR